MKTLTRIAFTAVVLLAWPTGAHAQAVRTVEVPPDQMRSSLESGSAPIYPAFAQAARVRDVLLVKATIGPTGSVESAVIERGHPMLDAAALKAVSSWRFRPPTVGGEPVRVVTSFSLIFSLPGDSEAIRAQWDEQRPVQVRCVTLGRMKQWAEAEAACRVAADRSRAWQFAEEVHVDATLYLAEALNGLGRPADAVPVLQGLLKRGADVGFSPGRHDARRVLAAAYVALGDLPNAADVYNKMESVLSDWLGRARIPTEMLRIVRLEYADILDKLGKPKDAQKMREAAAKLK